MDSSRRLDDQNGTEKVDHHVRGALGRSRPLQHVSALESGRRENRIAPVALAHIKRNRSERLTRRAADELRRRDRVLGHTILGAVAFTVFLAMLLITGNLVTFVVAVVAVFVGLRSLTFAISIRLDDPWGWTRDGGMSVPLRWSDHIVLAGMAWLHRRSDATIDRPAAGAIQVLPPDPPR